MTLRHLALATILIGGGCASAGQTLRTTRPTTSTTTEPLRSASSRLPSFDEGMRYEMARAAAVRVALVGHASRGAKRVPRPTSAPVALAPPDGFARASWYARGARTASGAAFDPDGLTFAHLSMPFGTRVRFCHDDRCVVAACTDRGPAEWTGRMFDLSRGAFAAIADLSAGVVTVSWEVVE